MATAHRAPEYRKVARKGREYAVTHVNGRIYRLGGYETAASQEKFHRLVAEWFASGCSKSFGKPVRNLVIGELVDDYTHHCEAYYGTGPNSELHRCSREATVIDILCELYGSLSATEFGPVQFKAVRHRLTERGLSRSFMNASMKRLVRMFKWAASEAKLPPAVPQVLALIPGLRYGQARETAPVKPVDESLVDATLLHLQPAVADMVRLHRLTGMRPGEVCQIRPADVDRSGDVWEFRPRQHKTLHHGRERVIFIGPHAQNVLRPYLLRDAESFCFVPREVMAKFRASQHAARKTPMSCGNRAGTNRKRRPKKRPGDCYNPRSYHNAIQDACSKAFPAPKEISNDAQAVAQWRASHRWTPNQLRHSTATEIRRRFGLEAAQVVLGHAQASITQVYAERDFALAARVAREVG